MPVHFPWPVVFSSPIFLFWFLPLVLLCYHLVRPAYRNALLLVCSLLFYTWGEKEMVLIMLLSTLGFYLGGLWVGMATGMQRRLALAASVCFSLGMLVYFKYTNFFAANYNGLAAAEGWQAWNIKKIMLPLGISFYTFHGLSYIIDIYRRQVTVQRNPADLALYIAFFPQLIAGPIVRYHDIAEQLANRSFDAELFASGVRRFIIGLAKKVLVANYVGRVAGIVFALPADQLNAPLAWIGLLAVSVQIYFDFSGYSDMAIGLARMFGFRFRENFVYPLSANSMRDFWNRWHISLSGWFRDYVYFALGGSKKGKLRTQLNLWTIFLLMGFWHGAEWTFIAFGAWHGIFIVLERTGAGRLLERLPFILRNGYVWLIYMGGNIIFSSPDMQHAVQYAGSLFSAGADTRYLPVWMYIHRYFWLVLALGLVFNYPVAEWLLQKCKIRWEGKRPQLLRSSRWALWGCYMLLLVACMSEIAVSAYNPFIYFRF